MKSRSTPQKGKECINKLGASASIHAINSFSGNIEANEVHFEKTNVTSLEMLSDDEKKNSKNFKIHKKSAHTRHKKINFSPLEDNFIKDGLKKHGHGKWTSIFKGHKSRTSPFKKRKYIINKGQNKMIYISTLFNPINTGPFGGSSVPGGADSPPPPPPPPPYITSPFLMLLP